MAKRIAKKFIDNLLNRVDIVNVVNKRVPLKKSGKDYQACCPFHDEKTPSFSVSQLKQFYYCFGCGAKGNAISFLMDYENLQFVEAVEKLAEESGINVEYEQLSRAEIAKVEQRKTLYDVLDEVASLYQKNLDDNSIGKEARQYLSERQLDEETVAFFRLGYAQAGNTLQSVVGQGIGVDELQKTGLLNKGEHGYYDFFRHRLMFPIRDPRGRVLGFGARALTTDAKPKYLNTGETELFNKSNVLYGLYEELQSNRQIEHLIVVEGYMDVIALHQNGVQGSVAALGTAFTAGHLQLIYRYTKKIYICFDGDNAGKKAAERAIQLMLPAIHIDTEIRMVFLPDGEDPDTLVRKIGKDAFIDKLGQGQLFSEFIYDSLIGDNDLSHVEGRGEVAARAKTLFDGLPQNEYKTILYQGLTEKIGMDIYRLADGEVQQKAKISPASYSRPRPQSLGGGLESRLIRLLTAQPQLAIYATNENLLHDSDSVDREILYRLIQYLQTCHRREGISEATIAGAFDKEHRQRLEHITTTEHLIEKAISESPESLRQRQQQEFLRGLEKLLNAIRRKRSL